MNNTGGTINILLMLLFFVFVLLALMNPILQLTDEMNNQIAINQGITKTGRDPITQETVDVGVASGLGDLTMLLIMGVGLFILIGIIIYIVRFGPEPPDFAFDRRRF